MGFTRLESLLLLRTTSAKREYSLFIPRKIAPAEEEAMFDLIPISGEDMGWGEIREKGVLNYA